MHRAITGFVTTAGTLLLRPIGQGRPQAFLKGEGYIFFDTHALFNRIMKDRLYVKTSWGEVVPFHRYDMRMAEHDFETLAMEV
jgi:hypothetical protein